MGVPIIIIAGEGTTAYLFVYTTIVSVICFSILLLIFVPKIMAIHSKEQTERGSVSIMNSSMKVGGKKVKLGDRISMSGEVLPVDSKDNTSLMGFAAPPEMSQGNSVESDSGVGSSHMQGPAPSS
jgi:hypothetical protein